MKVKTGNGEPTDRRRTNREQRSARTMKHSGYRVLGSLALRRPKVWRQKIQQWVRQTVGRTPCNVGNPDVELASNGGGGNGSRCVVDW